MKRSLALFFLIIFFAACSSDNVPGGIIKKDKMIKILTDIHLADGYASVNYADTGMKKVAVLYKAIYKKYDTDSVQVRRSVEYYTQRPDLMQPMYEEINAAMAQMTKDAQALDDQRFREREKRMRDSLFYHDKRLDSLNKGFKIDTLPYAPFQKFVLKKTTVSNNTGGLVDTIRRRDTLLRPAPVKRFRPGLTAEGKRKNDLSTKRIR